MTKLQGETNMDHYNELSTDWLDPSKPYRVRRREDRAIITYSADEREAQTFITEFEMELDWEIEARSSVDTAA